MEDALVPNKTLHKWQHLFRLNPCFNGRCTSTLQNGIAKGRLTPVLILVLMEDALVLQEDVVSGQEYHKS